MDSDTDETLVVAARARPGEAAAALAVAVAVDADNDERADTNNNATRRKSKKASNGRAYNGVITCNRFLYRGVVEPLWFFVVRLAMVCALFPRLVLFLRAANKSIMTLLLAKTPHELSLYSQGKAALMPITWEPAHELERFLDSTGLGLLLMQCWQLGVETLWAVPRTEEERAALVLANERILVRAHYEFCGADVMYLAFRDATLGRRKPSLGARIRQAHTDAELSALGCSVPYGVDGPCTYFDRLAFDLSNTLASSSSSPSHSCSVRAMLHNLAVLMQTAVLTSARRAVSTKRGAPIVHVRNGTALLPGLCDADFGSALCFAESRLDALSELVAALPDQAQVAQWCAEVPHFRAEASANPFFAGRDAADDASPVEVHLVAALAKVHYYQIAPCVSTHKVQAQHPERYEPMRGILLFREQQNPHPAARRFFDMVPANGNFRWLADPAVCAWTDRQRALFGVVVPAEPVVPAGPDDLAWMAPTRPVSTATTKAKRPASGVASPAGQRMRLHGDALAYGGDDDHGDDDGIWEAPTPDEFRNGLSPATLLANTAHYVAELGRGGGGDNGQPQYATDELLDVLADAADRKQRQALVTMRIVEQRHALMAMDPLFCEYYALAAFQSLMQFGSPFAAMASYPYGREVLVQRVRNVVHPARYDTVVPHIVRALSSIDSLRRFFMTVNFGTGAAAANLIGREPFVFPTEPQMLTTRQCDLVNALFSQPDVSTLIATASLHDPQRMRDALISPNKQVGDAVILVEIFSCLCHAPDDPSNPHTALLLQLWPVMCLAWFWLCECYLNNLGALTDAPALTPAPALCASAGCGQAGCEQCAVLVHDPQPGTVEGIEALASGIIECALAEEEHAAHAPRADHNSNNGNNNNNNNNNHNNNAHAAQFERCAAHYADTDSPGGSPFFAPSSTAPSAELVVDPSWEDNCVSAMMRLAENERMAMDLDDPANFAADGTRASVADSFPLMSVASFNPFCDPFYNHHSARDASTPPYDSELHALLNALF